MPMRGTSSTSASLAWYASIERPIMQNRHQDLRGRCVTSCSALSREVGSFGLRDARSHRLVLEVHLDVHVLAAAVRRQAVACIFTLSFLSISVMLAANR